MHLQCLMKLRAANKIMSKIFLFFFYSDNKSYSNSKESVNIGEGTESNDCPRVTD